MEPKFEEYTYEELLDVHRNINRNAYPERFRKISALIQKRQMTQQPEPTSNTHFLKSLIKSDKKSGVYTVPPTRNIDESGIYIANEISLKERIINLIVALCLLAYGLNGFYTGEIYIPSRSRGGIHLYQESVWIMFIALICGAGAFIITVLDHYDKRDNEHTYFKYGQLLKNMGVALFCVVVMWEIFVVR